jgi:hypothetical protein
MTAHFKVIQQERPREAGESMVLDFPNPDPGPALRFEGRVSYALLSIEGQDPTSQDADPRLWRDCCVYVLVTATLVLVNAFVRIHPDTPTPPGELRDAARFLFPNWNTSSPALKPAAMYIAGREDIQSFGFDLGGSTCACELQWDAQQYWQRVFYGTKYAAFHCTMVFFGVLCLQRPQWVILWKVLNEVLEEIGMPIVGKFAWTVSVFNLESLYDTLINDMLVAVVPFSALGLHVVTVLELPDPIRHPAEVDRAYLLQMASIFLQYIMFSQANQSHICLGLLEWTFDGVACKVGKLTSCLLQIALLWLLVVLHKLSRKSAGAISVLVSVLWALFVVHRVWYYDEQIIAILSCLLVGISVCCYQWYTGAHPRLLMTALPCYALALWIWWDFEAIVDPSVDRFYYHAQWCGLSESPSTSGSWFSCASSA